MPDGYFTTTAKNDVCPNPLFAGLSYPDKLDSYSHGPMGTPLVKDVSGASGRSLRTKNVDILCWYLTTPPVSPQVD